MSATLAPTSSASAAAITTLAQTVAVLARNSSQFETLLQSLDDVSTQGRSILESYYPQIMTQLQTLQAVSGQLAQHQADLAGLLSEIPVAHDALPQAVRNGYVQLDENIIVCGIPGLGEGRGPPAFTCSPHGRGRARDSRRLIFNLIVFFLVSFALVAYGVVDLLGNPL